MYCILRRFVWTEAKAKSDGLRPEGWGHGRIGRNVVDADVMRRIREAAPNSDLATIQAGIDDMEADRMQSASEAHAHGRM